MTWVNVFTLVGIATTIGIVASVGVALSQNIKNRIEKAKHRYRVKHRFDKPPTAECYCVDCQRYEPKKGLRNGRCRKFDTWYVADNWFCWDATPKEKAGGQE